MRRGLLRRNVYTHGPAADDFRTANDVTPTQTGNGGAAIIGTFVMNTYVVLRQPEIGELVFGVPAPGQRRVALVHHGVQALQSVLALLAERAGRPAVDHGTDSIAAVAAATAAATAAASAAAAAAAATAATAVRTPQSRVAAAVRAGRHLYGRRARTSDLTARHVYAVTAGRAIVVTCTRKKIKKKNQTKENNNENVPARRKTR